MPTSPVNRARALALLISAGMLATLLTLSACGPKPIKVLPAEPLPPAKVVLPRSITDPVTVPNMSGFGATSSMLSPRTPKG